MARPGVGLSAVVLSLVAACSSGDKDPTSSAPPAVLLETVEFASVGRGCRARGTLFNRTSDSTYEVSLRFEAADFEENHLGEATAFIADVPPQTRVPYQTTAFGDGTIACTSIVRFNTDGSEVRCTSGRGPGCR
jgi:hypothetical protein